MCKFCELVNAAKIFDHDLKNNNDELLKKAAKKIDDDELCDIIRCKKNNGDLKLRYFECILEGVKNINGKIFYDNSKKYPLLPYVLKTIELDETTIDYVKLLVKYGVDVNLLSEDREHNSLMSLFLNDTMSNKYDIAKYLIEVGIDISARTFGNKNNALHILCQYVYDEKWDETAELLIDAGIDINEKNKHGKTPMDYTEKLEAVLEKRKDAIIASVRQKRKDAIIVSVRQKMEEIDNLLAQLA